jgi:hypothetical protein
MTPDDPEAQVLVQQTGHEVGLAGREVRVADCYINADEIFDGTVGISVSTETETVRWGHRRSAASPPTPHCGAAVGGRKEV